MNIRPLASWLLSGAFTCAGAAFALTGCGGRASSAAAPDASVPDAASDGNALDQTSAGGDSLPPSDAGADIGPICEFACGDAGAHVSPSCPAAPPAPGSPCTGNEVCEYGTSWWLECDVVVRCVQPGQPGEGTWTFDFDGGGCPWLDSGGPCPATWAEASSIDAQARSCPFVTCVYPEGFCGCGIGCGGVGGLPPKPLDVQGFFVCIPSTPDCPEPRPRSGTACQDASFACGYSFACGCGQSEFCVDGLWQAVPGPVCP